MIDKHVLRRSPDRMKSQCTERGSTWTNLDSGLRVVEWLTEADVGHQPRAGRFQEQRWSSAQLAWVPTGKAWDETSWNEVAWRQANPQIRRGPIPDFVPEGALLFLGTVHKKTNLTLGDSNDEGPDAWSSGRFSMQHQCAGAGMQQALLDGAFFHVRGDDPSPLASGLRELTGPYELWELDDQGADAVAAKAGSLLNATPLPSAFERPCGEALHLFQLNDAVVQCITEFFPMAMTLFFDVGIGIEELGPAPFSTVAELSTWRRVDVETLVAALVYENCD